MRRALVSLIAFALGGIALAAPASAQNICTFVDSSGNKVACSTVNPLPTTGGGGGGTSGGTATAAAPTYTEAATAQPLSLDLNGYQRVRAKQDGAWSFSVANGSDVAEGNTADSAYTDVTGATAGTLNSLNKGQFVSLQQIYARQASGQNITNISGTISLPTGASTSANQASELTALAPLTTGVPPKDMGAVTVTGATANLQVVFSQDTTGYAGVTYQPTGTFVATSTFQGSNDNTNWYTIAAYNTSTYVIATTNAGITTAYYIPAVTRYVRVQVTAFTSGTVGGTALLVKNAPVGPVPATVALGSGANTIGNVGLVAGAASVGTVGLNAGTQAVGSVVPAPSLTVGLATYTRFSLSAAATTNATSVKATAARIISGEACNTTVSYKFLKFYNKASAPAVGTDTPVYTLILAPSTCQYVADSLGIYGMSLSTGFALAITGAFADTDTTALVLGDVVLNILYL